MSYNFERIVRGSNETIYAKVPQDGKNVSWVEVKPFSVGTLSVEVLMNLPLYTYVFSGANPAQEKKLPRVTRLEISTPLLYILGTTNLDALIRFFDEKVNH